MSLVLDTHVLYWWTSDVRRLSDAASRSISDAAELTVSAITWYELAIMARKEVIQPRIPVREWLAGLAQLVRTIALTPGVAITAAELPATFGGDPADRIIYATAIERGWQLVTKDDRIREHAGERAIW